MRRFITKIIVFLLGMVVLSAILCRLCMLPKNQYAQHSHEINLRLATERLENIKSPKIIIIGGSGCGFGINSKKISKTLNMPVVNTGVHAGIGLKAQVDLFKEYIDTGDIILLIPEYANYNKNFYLGSEETIQALSSVFPQGYHKLEFFQKIYLLQFAPHFCQNAILSKKLDLSSFNTPYSEQSVNEYGDETCFLQRKHQDSISIITEGTIEDINRHTIQFIYNFKNYCTEKHAKLLLFPPAFNHLSYDNNDTYINAVAEKLKIYHTPFVCPTNKYRLNDSLFYDTPYHMTKEGVEIRTNMLIEDISALLRLP